MGDRGARLGHSRRPLHATQLWEWRYGPLNQQDLASATAILEDLETACCSHVYSYL